MTRPAVAALRAQIASKIRAIHHYGNPPDPRLQHDVDGDVEDILEDVQALVAGAALEAPPECDCVKCDSKGFYEVPLGAHHDKHTCTVCGGTGKVRGEAPPEPTRCTCSAFLHDPDCPERGEAGPLPPSKTLVEVEWVRAILAAGDKVLDGWGGNRHEQNVEAFRVAMAVRGVVPAPPPEPLEWLLSRIEALTEEQAAYLLDVWSEEIPGNWRQQLFLDLTTEAERQSGRAAPAPQEGP